MSLKKSVALITGGVQGFGRAFTEKLLKEGAKVSVLKVLNSIIYRYFIYIFVIFFLFHL